MTIRRLFFNIIPPFFLGIAILTYILLQKIYDIYALIFISILFIWVLWKIIKSQTYFIILEILCLGGVFLFLLIYYYIHILTLHISIYLGLSMLLSISFLWLLHRIDETNIFGSEKKLIIWFEIISIIIIIATIIFPSLVNLQYLNSGVILLTFLIGEVLFNLGVIIILVDLSRQINWKNIKNLKLSKLNIFHNLFLLGFLINRLGAVGPWFVILYTDNILDVVSRYNLLLIITEIYISLFVTYYYIANYKKQKINYRKASVKDSNALHELEKRSWFEGGEATVEMYKSRINIFPEGVICAEQNNKLVGVVVFERISENNNFKTWYDYTDNGFITNSHNHTGNYLFGINLAVDTDYRNQGVGGNLMKQVYRYAIKNNLKKVLLGSRAPDYYKYSHNMSIDEYVYAKDEKGRVLDPELRLYLGKGLKIEKIVADYFYDTYSENYGIIVSLDNELYSQNKIVQFIHRHITANIIPNFI